MKGKLTFTSKQITGIAVLFALVIILQALGATISIGPVQLNFTLIPIVLGAIIFGPIVGAFLGFISGVIVLSQVIMGAVPFYTLIWTNDPVATVFTCLLKTTVAGYLSGLAYSLIKNKNEILSVFIASAIVPVVNTAIFVVGCLFMTNSVYAMANGTNVIAFILVSLVTFNFFFELAVNLILAPTLKKVLKYIKI
jgi:uncharacterized membrane protein